MALTPPHFRAAEQTLCPPKEAKTWDGPLDNIAAPGSTQVHVEDSDTNWLHSFAFLHPREGEEGYELCGVAVPGV